jgi:putative transposase
MGAGAGLILSGNLYLFYQQVHNQNRVHTSLDGKTPSSRAKNEGHRLASLVGYSWKSHCRGLFQLPMPV